METNKNFDKRKNQEFEPIPDELNKLGRIIVESAFTVHKNLGPGLLEKVYEICFCYELEKRGINYVRQLEVPIVYDMIKFNEGLRLGFLINFNATNIGNGLRRFVL